MRKSTRLIKRFAALFLVVLMSIDGFAAVVTDNDGSAFITKAEFDSLKNDFQNQLDKFNASIDSKINAEITNYLAGIKSKYTLKLRLTKGLTYPLSVRHLGPYEGVDVKNITTLQEATDLWTDDYDIDLNNQRHAISAFLPQPLHKNPKNRINNFYNGKKITADYFLIENMWNNYNVTGVLNSNYHHYSNTWTSREGWGWYIFLDVTKDDTSGGQTHSDAWTRTAYATNARRLTLPTDERPCYMGVWGQIAQQSTTPPATLAKLSTVSGGKKWATVTRTAGQGFVEHTVSWVTWMQAAEKNITELNDILISRAKGAEDTELYLPVLYDGKIKVTNIETAKTNLNTGIIKMTENINGSETKNSAYMAMHAVIDPGYVIDSENNKKSGTTWDTTSLIAGNRLKYTVYTPYTNVSKQCTMGEGILLTEIEGDADSAELVITPSWNETQQTVTSAKKYILLSKEPITEDMTDILESANPDKYIDISTSATSDALKYKLIELNNNVENKIYLGKLDKGDLLYYKIVWGYDNTNADRWKETITISNPGVTITKTN